MAPMPRTFVTGIEGTTKLSQTHPEGDRQRIIDGLAERPIRL